MRPKGVADGKRVHIPVPLAVDADGMTREATPGRTTVVPVQGASLRGAQANPCSEVSF